MLIPERIDAVLRDQLGTGITWSGDTLLTGDDEDSLKLDSLDLTELVMRLEEQFTIRIPDEDCLEGLTIDRLAQLIEARTDSKPAMPLG